jgi:hypothetical protein
MMTRRTRLIIFALLFLVLLLLLLLMLWFLWPRTNEPSVAEVEATPQVEVVQEVVSRPTISEQELEGERESRVTAADVLSLSKTFVTRFGSYSNEANFANLSDVLPLASASFSTELQNIIDTSIPPEEYYGVTTSIVTVKVVEKDETAGTASTIITTQREEAIGSPQNVSVKYQEIVLTFVNEEGVWKVDSATWQ